MGSPDEEVTPVHRIKGPGEPRYDRGNRPAPTPAELPPGRSRLVIYGTVAWVSAVRDLCSRTGYSISELAETAFYHSGLALGVTLPRRLPPASAEDDDPDDVED